MFGLMDCLAKERQKISLFSQSLFALSLEQAIETTQKVGYPAMELACVAPHFDLEMARANPQAVAARIKSAGLTVSALSLFNSFTDPTTFDQQIEAAAVFIRLAPLFETGIVKLTPGPPSSGLALEEHWRLLERALHVLVPLAEEVGVRLAFETHMRQLTDTLASSKRLLQLHPSSSIGLTVDFSNMAFAGEAMPEVVTGLRNRMYNTHLKNGYIDPSGVWQFQALDRGLTDYAIVLRLLREIGYNGYMTIECLGSEAQAWPAETATRDLEILRRLLDEAGMGT